MKSTSIDEPYFTLVRRDRDGKLDWVAIARFATFEAATARTVLYERAKPDAETTVVHESALTLDRLGRYERDLAPTAEARPRLRLVK